MANKIKCYLTLVHVSVIIRTTFFSYSNYNLVKNSVNKDEEKAYICSYTSKWPYYANFQVNIFMLDLY